MNVMINTKLTAALCLVSALAGSKALAQEELIEKVVVRNRLYTMAGKNEVGLAVGLTVLSRLTDHINFNLHYARNVAETIAFELRAGYAYSRHTRVAQQVALDYMGLNVSKANDLTDLWEMNGNASMGIRWAPIYGRISLMSEIPVHFQAYLWAGAGVGQFKRKSLVVCNDKVGGECKSYYSENKWGPMATGAFGTRFFVSQRHSLKIEVRDYSYPDSYLENVDRLQALNPATPEGGGERSKSPGIINLVQVDLGYSFLF
jgi:outer membrane beta-barrel protein